MVMSIFKFLQGYYGVALDAGVDLTHTVAKRNFKFLKGCPYKYAAHNPELVKNGKIVYIKDSHGTVYPYICPDIIKTTNNTCTYTEDKENNIFKDDKTILEELDELPTYMVRELLSKYKDRPSFYRLIKSELIYRGVYKNKAYKLQRELIEIGLEEGGKNDKYQRRREIKRKKS